MNEVRPVEELSAGFIFENKVIKVQGNEYQTKGRTWRNSTRRISISELYPGVLQGSKAFNDKKFAAYQLYKDLLSDEPDSEDNAGGWKGILTDFAYPATLAPFAPESNIEIRKNFGLREPDIKERALFSKICETIVKNSELQPVHHREVSSSGAPYFITGSAYKKDMLRHCYTADNFRKFRQAICENNLVEMRSFGVLNIYTQGIRKHAVAGELNENFEAYTEKQRLYQTWDDIMHGRSSKFTKVDFSHPDPRMLAFDIRSMYAVNSTANFANQVINNALMAGFKVISDIVRYKGEVTLSAELKQFIKKNELRGRRVKIFSLDKRKFGETFCSALTEELFKVLWHSKFKELMPIVDAVLHWPTYYKWIERDVDRSLLSFDNAIQLKNEAKFKAAFKSGNGLVALMGKLLGTFDILLIAINALPHLDVKEILANASDDVFIKNSGDDTLVAIAECFYDEFKANMKFSLHADEVEEKCLFLGYYYSQSGDVHVDIGKFALHMNCFERGFHSKSCPRAGIIARMEIYSRNPYFLEAMRIESETLLKFCGVNLQKYLDEGDPASATLLANVQTVEDLMFLSNPELLYYKEDMLTNVSQPLVSHFYKVTEPDEYEFILAGQFS